MGNNLKVLGKMHINYKDWQKYGKWIKAIGINTFAELEMYCRIWKVKDTTDLLIKICEDYMELCFENMKREVEKFGNN